MIDKSILYQMNVVNIELKDLKERLIKLENKPQKNVVDSVQGSSTNYPYIKHNYRIEGMEHKRNKNTKKYEKMIKSKEYKLDKLKNELEYNLNYVQDSEIRTIMRFIYEDGYDYNQTAHKMNENSKRKKYTADSIRMKIKRFLKNL